MAQRLDDDQLPHVHVSQDGREPALEAWHACLEALHEQGILRVLHDAIEATPQLAEKVVGLLNGPTGLRVSNNAVLMLQLAGSLEPDELKRLVNALTTAVELMGAGYAGKKPRRVPRFSWWRLVRALRFGLAGFIAALRDQPSDRSP
jgi:uncharacterized protein YjgD (DUF1641 family)